VGLAGIDLTGCTANTSATGWYGTWISSDSYLETTSLSRIGYPARAKCPDKSEGESGTTTNGTDIVGTTCPGTGNWPGSTWQSPGSTVAPYTTAEIWVTTVPIGQTHAGAVLSAETIRSYGDTTDGDSGGPLYSSSDFLIVGVVNGSTAGPDGAWNLFNRFSSTRYDFLHSSVPFP
jgi:hypothetical protein